MTSGGSKPNRNNELVVFDAGTKQSAGKLKIALIPSAVIEGLASVFTWGCSGKVPPYPPRNWEKGIMFSEIYSAIQRHLLKGWRREANDPESGISHWWHAMWGCGALGFYSLFPAKYQLFDDRPDHDLLVLETGEDKVEVPTETWADEKPATFTEHGCHAGWSDGTAVACERMAPQRLYSAKTHHDCEGKIVEGQAADCRLAIGTERRYV